MAATLVLFLGWGSQSGMPQTAKPGSGFSLTREQAAHFAALALKCIRQEYPNKPEHVLNGVSDVRSPKALHPAFYGCFDWHSSVHGHWMLVRSCACFPTCRRVWKSERHSTKTLQQKASAPRSPTSRLPIGSPSSASTVWAWLLKLVEELNGWQDDDGQRWSRNLRPLANAIASRYVDFLPKQTYPIRTGVHPNTAFGLAFGFDYARALGNRELENLIAERARAYYRRDAAYPAAWEPGGEDFFSPSLMEADLMRRVLPRDEFPGWFNRFLPDTGRGEPKSLLEPASVTRPK